MKTVRWLLKTIFLVEIDEKGRCRCPPAAVLAGRTGNLFAVLALLPLVVLQLVSLVQSPQFGPASLVEETAYTYTSANNYLKYGFLNSGLLQDFSNSPHSEDHPFVYTHMPPGPDLFTAILLGFSGHNYALARLIFAGIFLIGIACFVRFADLMLRQFGLAGGGFALLFFWPWILVQGMDRLIYSPFPVLAFGPILLVHYYQGSGRTWALVLAAVSAFLGSIYLEYVLLTGVLVSWILLYFLQLLPIGRREVVALTLPVFLGIFAHLVQNYLFLGHDIFFRELVNVLSNRITGLPSQESLKAWYREIGVVHHGSKSVSLRAISEQVKGNFHLYGASKILSAAAIGAVAAISVRRLRDRAVLFYFRKDERRLLKSLFKMIVWVTATVLAPIAIFPAFAQEVNLRGSGANVFFLSILAVALTGFALQQIYRHFFQHIPVRFTVFARDFPFVALVAWNPASKLFHTANGEARTLRWRLIGLGRVFVALVVSAVLLHGFTLIINQRLQEYVGVYGTYRSSSVKQFEDLRRFAGELYMTNINTPIVGFLTGSPGLGVCNPDSVGETGVVDLAKCKVAFMRRYEYWLKQNPRYFVFFESGEYFPGFADCIPRGVMPGQERGSKDCVKDLENRLTKNYRLVLENSLFKIFDLAMKAPQIQ